MRKNITISGNLVSGKSTAGEIISKHLDYEIYAMEIS